MKKYILIFILCAFAWGQTPIDVGGNGVGTIATSADYLIVDATNPANGTGTIDSVRMRHITNVNQDTIWVGTGTFDYSVPTLEVYTPRDFSFMIVTGATGQYNTFALNEPINVVEGDVIACWTNAGNSNLIFQTAYLNMDTWDSRYTNLKRISQTGLSTVHQADIQWSGGKVAVKVAFKVKHGMI